MTVLNFSLDDRLDDIAAKHCSDKGTCSNAYEKDILDVVVGVLIDALPEVNNSTLFRAVLVMILVVGAKGRVLGLIVGGGRVRLGDVGDGVLLDVVLLLPY